MVGGGEARGEAGGDGSVSGGDGGDGSGGGDGPDGGGEGGDGCMSIGGRTSQPTVPSWPSG